MLVLYVKQPLFYSLHLIFVIVFKKVFLFLSLSLLNWFLGWFWRMLWLLLGEEFLEVGLQQIVFAQAFHHAFFLPWTLTLFKVLALGRFLEDAFGFIIALPNVPFGLHYFICLIFYPFFYLLLLYYEIYLIYLPLIPLLFQNKYFPFLPVLQTLISLF